MAALDFGIVMRVSSRGGALSDVTAMNDRILAALLEIRFSRPWVVDHLQFDSVPLWSRSRCWPIRRVASPGVPVRHTRAGAELPEPGAWTAKIATSLHFSDGRKVHPRHRRPAWAGGGVPCLRLRLPAGIGGGSPNWRRRCKSSVRCGPSPRQTFTGAHFAVTDAYCEPRPQPTPVLMIGGAGERRTLRVVARHADWWNADYYTPAEYGRQTGHSAPILHGDRA